MHEEFPRNRFNQEFPGVERAKEQFHEHESELLESLGCYALAQNKRSKSQLIDSMFAALGSFETLVRTTMYSPDLEDEERAELLAETYIGADTNRIVKLQELTPGIQYKEFGQSEEDLAKVILHQINKYKNEDNEMAVVDGLTTSFVKGLFADVFALDRSLNIRGNWLS